MKKLNIMFTNLRIRHKMLTVFLPLMIIPMLLVGLISYFIFQHNEVKKTIQDRMNSSYLIKQRIENVIQNTESCLDMITFYMNDLSGFLTEGSVGTTSEIDRKYAIENKLNFALLVFTDVKEAIFVDNQQRIYAANDRSITSVNAKEQIQAYIDQLQATSGYSKGFEMTRFSFGNGEQSQIVLPLGKKITEIKSGETLGELILFVSEDQISSLFEQMNDLKTSNFYLIDENHRIISSTDRNEVLHEVSNPVLNPLLQSSAAEGNVMNYRQPEDRVHQIPAEPQQMADPLSSIFGRADEGLSIPAKDLARCHPGVRTCYRARCGETIRLYRGSHPTSDPHHA